MKRISTGICIVLVLIIGGCATTQPGSIDIRSRDVSDQTIQSLRGVDVDALMAQKQQPTAARGAIEATRQEMPRQVVAGVPFDKTNFKQVPVYFENKYKGKKLAGHYTGMVNKKNLPYGWGQLKLDNGVTVVSYFRGGAARALTRVRFNNGDKTYLAFANGSSFCRPKYDYIVYDKDFLFFRNCSKTQWAYGFVHGVSYSKEVVALGDHPTGNFSSMLMKGSFTPWKVSSVHDKRSQGVPWRYAMYSPKNKTLDIEYSNKVKRKKYVRHFENGRSWASPYQPSFKYGGRYDVFSVGDIQDARLGNAVYIHSLGFKLDTVAGYWVEDKIPEATIRRFRNEYSEF